MKTAIPKPSKQSIIREARDYVMIAIGMILYGIGWTVFLLPNDITTGGSTRYCFYCILGYGFSRTVYVLQHQLLFIATGPQIAGDEVLH